MVNSRHATPIGATFMTMSMTFAMTLKTPSSSAITGAALSRDTSVSAAPNTMEKNMMPIMSGVDRAIDSSGLAGTSVRDERHERRFVRRSRRGDLLRLHRRTAPSADRASPDRAAVPGRTVLARRMPSATEINRDDQAEARPSARPTRPRRRTSPMPATPTMSDETTRGTTVISSERRNS